MESFNEGQEGEGIVVDKFESADGRLMVRVKYPSADVYTAYNTDSYNHKTLFCGTVAEAQEKGYDFDISMTDAKGEKSIGKEDILGMGSSKILIAEFPSRVKVTGKILYVGENVAGSGKKIILSARKRSWHSLQSIKGSEKPPRCPDATHVWGFIRIAQSTPTL